jgi:hypothetical protein
LAEIAQRRGRKALEELAAVAKPDTLLAWYRKLIANKFDGSRPSIPTKKVRVIRAVVTKPNEEPSRTWCFAIVGKRPRQLARRTALQIIRSRWHIEDTGFNQWIKYWNLGHVFRHTPNTLTAVFLLWTLAFNLLQLYVYRRLGRCRRLKDPTETIRHIVEVMPRCSYPTRTHSLGDSFAEHQLTPRRSRAQVGDAEAPAS